MSKKFTTVVTVQGMQLLNQSIADQIDLALIKAVASTSAYPPEMLETLTDDNYKSANKAQETTINKIEPRGDGTLAMEIVFDGNDIQYDYTLNTVFIVAEVAGKERLFAVIRANQPQYMNAYDGSSRTNLQINFALKLDNSEANITIDSAALATTKDLNDLKDEVTRQFEAGDRSLKQEIAKNKQDADKNLHEVLESLEDRVALVNKNLGITRDQLTESIIFNFSTENNRAAQAENDLSERLQDQRRELTKADNDLSKNFNSRINDVNKRINDLNIQNLVYNSEFANDLDGWEKYNLYLSDNNIFQTDNEWDSWKGSSGVAFRNTTNVNGRLSLTSKGVKVAGYERISASVQLHVTDNVTNGNNKARMELVFFRTEFSRGYVGSSNQTTQEVRNVSNGFQQLLYCDNVTVPDNAKYVAIRLISNGVGNFIFNQPMMSFSSSYVPYTQNTGLLGTLAGKYPKLDTRLNKIEESISKRKMPTSWFLDRTTTPWTIWFDNGCTLQFPDYKTSTTIYGYGHTSSTVGTDFVGYPLPYNIIRAANGGITVEKFKQANSGFEYWAPSTKVNNPVHKDTDFNWKNAYGDPGTKDVSYGRKIVFARVMYELGIWDADDVISVGAIRR